VAEVGAATRPVVGDRRRAEVTTHKRVLIPITAPHSMGRHVGADYAERVDQLRTSRFAAVYPPAQPGLPRGVSRLPAKVAREQQRDRLLRAAISAFAEKGYVDTNVADIVSRARVSRREFYTHFTNTEDCFIAAATSCATVLFRRISDVGTNLPPIEAMRAVIRSYLTLCAAEPEFTKCLIIDLPAAGERGMKGRHNGDRKFARLLEKLHRDAQKEHPDWPSAPKEAYLAAVGMIVELVGARIVSGNYASLPHLTDRLHTLITRMLGIPLSGDA
jgi:AcrR family transcriptional regulator